MLLLLSSFSLCYCRRCHYHRIYQCYYRFRLSIYDTVIVLFIIAFTSVIIVILFLYMLLSSLSLSSLAFTNVIIVIALLFKLLSSSSLLPQLLVLLSLSSFYLRYCRLRQYHRFYWCYYLYRPSIYIIVVVVGIIIAFTSVVNVTVLFILCRRQNYHRFYQHYYCYRPSLYVFVVVVIIIAFTSVIIVIVLLFMLLSSSSLSSPLLVLSSLSSFSLSYCRRRHCCRCYQCYYRYRHSLFVIVLVLIIIDVIVVVVVVSILAFTSVIIVLVFLLMLLSSSL